jgi:hypothetical protein
MENPMTFADALQQIVDISLYQLWVPILYTMKPISMSSTLKGWLLRELRFNAKEPGQMATR